MSQQTHPTSIDRDYIRLLQAMRRFVREEFAVSIRMTQDDAIEQLLHYAGQSRNNVLQEMASELESYTHFEPESIDKESNSTESSEKVRYYRGVAIAVEEEAETQAEESKASSSAPKRIYRGRVIE